MKSLEYYGNPDDPFNGADIPYILGGQASLTDLSAEQINYMLHSPDGVTVDSYDSAVITRTVSFECSAPFEPSLEVFTNRPIYVLGKPLEETRIVADITLGDCFVNGSITKRWITLSRADGGDFGMTGISQQDENNNFEKWRALTLTMRTMAGILLVELWGETIDSDGIRAAHKLDKVSDTKVPYYCDSLRVAVFRSKRHWLEKTTSA